MKEIISYAFVLLIFVIDGKLLTISQHHHFKNIEKHQFDSFLPYPDKTSHHAIEVYYEDEEIRKVLSQIDTSTMSLIATERESFQCYQETQTEPMRNVPVIKNKPEKGAAVTVLDETNEPISKDKVLTEALKKKFDKHCFQKRVNYWTYIVCPFSKIEQTRFEYTVVDGKRALFPEQVISLGTYNEELSTIDTHIYDHGDSGRKTVVKFICAKQKNKSQQQDELGKITNVREPEPYIYEIRVSSLIACQKTKDKIIDEAYGKRIQGKEEFSEKELLLEVRRILKLIETQCFLHYKGWWSYEICLSYRIRQFHKNKDSTVEEFILGNLELLDGLPNINIENSQKFGRQVVSQRFSEGTPCDVTGKKRSSTVIYKCFDNVGFVEIMKLEESVSCGYEIVISLPLLCSLPGFSSSGTFLDEIEVQKTICFPENKIGLLEK